MQNKFFKVITASAGTGKTYRLSLEYIRLLLEYGGLEEFDFQQILAITFTKKATAEIRERIFSHLKILSLQPESKEGKDLINNLETLCGIQITPAYLKQLQKIYTEMMQNKQDVRISTIDSFTGNIFKSVIAPWKGINEYEIDQQYNEEIIPEVLEALIQSGVMSDEIIETLNKEFKINPEDHTSVLARLIDNRWQYKFIEKYDKKPHDEGAMDAFKDYFSALDSYISDFKSIVDSKDSNDYASFMKAGAIREFSNSDSQSILQTMFSSWTDLDYLKANFKQVLENIGFHNGTRVKGLKETAESIKQLLADVLYYSVYLDEWVELKKFWGVLLSEYDKRKLATSRLTYSDVASFTYDNMHDKEISIIDENTGAVTNRFYEFLSYRTRFLLIDEFQDTSVSQFKVFQPMIDEIFSGEGVSPYGGVIIVGDEKQAIYQWRSGERDLILKLKNIYKIEESKLAVCYRSSNAVMTFLNQLFQSETLQEYIKNTEFDWVYENDVKCFREEDQGEVKLYEFDFGTNDGNSVDIYPDFVDRCLKPNLRKPDGTLDCGGSAVIARTNKELNRIAAILTAEGIPFVQESNNSLFKHEGIKPIFHLMDFIIYKDRLSLLKFYRSNLYLLPPSEMKLYLQKYNKLSAEEFELYLDTLPGMQKIKSLTEYYNEPLQFVIKAMEMFNIIGLFKTENERKNLDKLLSVASRFKHERHDYTRNIAGFVLYCNKLVNEESHTVETVGRDDALTLISIHKSKGLAFKNVFAFNILGSSGNKSTQLMMNYKFDDEYRDMIDFDISLRSREVLKLTTKTDVIQQMERTEKLQELNAIYVSLTRAEDNLYLYYAKKLTKDGSISKGTEVNNVIYSISKEIVNDIDHGVIEPKVKKEEVKRLSFEGKEYTDYFKANISDLITELPKEERKSSQELSAIYLQSRKNVIGSIIHHYLSYISYAEPKYFDNAYKQTLSTFGNLLPADKIKEYIAMAKEFIDDNSDLFSDEWDKVLNEYTIFNPQTGKEYRIDRLQINTVEKQILIVDFKTGRIDDKEQLNTYKSIIAGLKHVKDEGYNIETRYVKLDLSKIPEE